MWCSERRIKNKLSLNCSGPNGGGGGGGGTRRGVLQKRGGGYLIVNDEQKGGRAWEIPELQWYVGGMGGGGECTHDNEGREWTGQFAKGEQQMQLQPSKQ